MSLKICRQFLFVFELNVLSNRLHQIVGCFICLCRDVKNGPIVNRISDKIDKAFLKVMSCSTLITIKI